MFSKKTKFYLFFIMFLLPLNLSFADEVSYKNRKNWATVQAQIRTKLGAYPIEIHFEKHNTGFAEKLLNVLKVDSPKLVEYFNYIPQATIHFIVEDNSLANGSATGFPSNIVKLYNAPPVNDQYLLSNENWIQGLVLHELTHIIHLDQTRGILQGLRSVFGSIGKLGGIVPRWFAEGAATWAETEFTKGGRLRNRLLSMELKHYISRDDFCSSIDCLDAPGVYPHGRNSYWMGAYFLQSLERQKAQSISCLIRANSDSIPFFLNSAFQECVGTTASKAFVKFRDAWRREILKDSANLKRKKIFKDFKKVPLAKFSPIDWQKGHFVRAGKFYFQTLHDRIPKVATYSLDAGKLTERRFAEVIGRFAADITKGPLIALSTLERAGIDVDKSSTIYQTKWIVWDTKNNKVENIQSHNDIEHLFFLQNKRKLFADFKENKWSFYLDKFQADEKPWLAFPAMANLTLLKTYSYRGKTYLLLRQQSNVLSNNRDELLIYEPLKNTLTKIFSSSEPLKFIGQCQNNFIFEGKKKLAFSLTNNRAREIKLATKFWQNVASYSSDGKNHLILSDQDPGHFYWQKSSCEKFIGKKKSQVMKSQEVLLGSSKSKSALADYDQEAYPSLRHFIPQYWMVSYGGTKKAAAVNAWTALADPKGRHTLSLKGKYYPDLSDYGQDLSYQYIWAPLIFKGIYNKSFSYSTSTKRTYTDEQFGGLVFWPINLGKWIYTPAISLVNENVDDIVSQRKFEKTRLMQNISTQKTFFDDFIQLYFLRIDLLKQKTKGYKSFIGIELLKKIDFKITRKFELHMRASYGKLKKSGFSSGVLYGGSSSDLGAENFHEFYGVYENDIFGNELFSARIQLDYLFREIYRGSGLMPLFFREFRWVLGADYIRADRIILKDRILKNEKLMSAHFGARFKVVLAYLFPLDVDILYVKLLGSQSSGQSNDSSVLFLFKSSLF